MKNVSCKLYAIYFITILEPVFKINPAIHAQKSIFQSFDFLLLTLYH